MIDKFLTGMVLFLMVLVVPAEAQFTHRNMENKSPDESAEMITNRMSAQLNLSEEQKIKTQGVYATFFSKQKELEKKYSHLEPAKKEMRALRESERSEVKSILTTEQLKQLREGRGSRDLTNHSHEPKTPKVKVERMKAELGLSSKQEADLLSVFQKTEEKRNEIKSNYPELEEAKKEMKTLKKDLFAELKEILTTTQFEELKTLKKGKRKQH